MAASARRSLAAATMRIADVICCRLLDAADPALDVLETRHCGHFVLWFFVRRRDPRPRRELLARHEDAGELVERRDELVLRVASSSLPALADGHSAGRRRGSLFMNSSISLLVAADVLELEAHGSTNRAILLRQSTRRS